MKKNGENKLFHLIKTTYRLWFPDRKQQKIDELEKKLDAANSFLFNVDIHIQSIEKAISEFDSSTDIQNLIARMRIVDTVIKTDIEAFITTRKWIENGCKI